MFLLLAGCRQDMHDQPRYEPLQASRLFADGRASRPLIEGTVPRGALMVDRGYYTGRRGLARPAVTAAQPVQAAQPAQAVQAAQAAAGQQAPASFDPDYVTEFPMPITRQILERGRQRFEMFCTPCHGYSGYGDGIIVQRGLKGPASFHTDRLKQAPVGHFFDVITNGFGAMYSYASRIPVDDRWAIIAYVRVLQLSQGASLNDVPESERAKLQQAQPSPQQPGTPAPKPGEMAPGQDPGTRDSPPGGNP